MSYWKAELIALVQAGKKPSYEQLERALSGSMEETEAYSRALHEMAFRMASILGPHVMGDALGVKAALDELASKHVRAMPAGAADSVTKH